ncbi:MAG: GIY-YIG nuclease family protein [Methanothrix sp.]|nr:GIY-YIG nuclease family protein [Methanothrix sp.]MCX8206473.1 GIY-YIG nuclease family protein [Methanothrix sp.]
MRGIYTLILDLEHGIRIRVGSIGEILFHAGSYAYTGSARGPGGFRRINRHVAVMNGENTTRRWHIDYLLPYVTLRDVITTATDMDLECEAARRIGINCVPVPRFGCTDCRCTSHLHYSASYTEVLSACREAHRSLLRDL